MYFALSNIPDTNDGYSEQDLDYYEEVQEKIVNTTRYLYEREKSLKDNSNGISGIEKKIIEEMKQQEKREEVLFDKIFSNAKAKILIIKLFVIKQRQVIPILIYQELKKFQI